MEDREPTVCWQCERRTTLCLDDPNAEWLTCEWCDANLEKAAEVFAELRQNERDRVERALGVQEFLDRKRL